MVPLWSKKVIDSGTKVCYHLGIDTLGLTLFDPLLTRKETTAMRTQRGFTLIELLVVIAIIAILAAILFPVFAQARAKARQATCLSNMKQVAMGLYMYVQDYDETLAGNDTNAEGYGLPLGFLTTNTGPDFTT